jgi:Family of unknown function (DUF6262)
MTDNSRHLIEAAARRRAATIARARQAIRRLDRAGRPVTFRSVAAEARVSRSWLYRDADIRAEIERLRADTPITKPALPSAQRATDESLRHRLDAVHAEVRRLREENLQLRAQLARQLGQDRASATCSPHASPTLVPLSRDRSR